MAFNDHFPWRILCCVLAQAWGSGAALAAPPPNNNFSNRTNLNNSLPVTASGTNVGATVEAGEPLPDSATKSVWWRWTAPSSGLIDISTTGSVDAGGGDPLDTVLAVYTGTALNALTLVAENDEAPQGLTSQVRFAAVANTTYVIQVTGYADAEGSIKLGIKAGPPPPGNDAFANAVTLTTGVAAAGTTGGATLQASEPVPQGVVATDYQGSAWWAWTAPETGWYRVAVTGAGYNTFTSVWSGNSLTGLTAVHANRGGGISVGEVEAGELFFPATGNTRYPIAMAVSSLLEGGAVSVTVTPAGPPVQNAALNVASATVNVTAAGATVNAVFRLVSAEAVQGGRVELARGADFHKSFPFDAAQRTSGTAMDGTYTVPLSFPRYLAPGAYRITGITTDLPGKVEAAVGELSPAPFASGAARTVTVTNTGSVDSAAPALTGVTVTPATVNLTTGPPTLTVTLQIADALSGFASGSVQLRRGASDTNEVSEDFGTAERTDGSAQNGTYRVVLPLPESLPADTYQLIVSGLADGLGNTDSVGQNSTEEGFPGPFSGLITVTKPAVHLLNSFTVAPASANVKDAAVNVTATFSVTSTQGEFTTGHLSFVHPSAEGNFKVAVTPANRTHGTATAGSYSVTFPVPQYLVPGGYAPELEIRGTAGPISRYAADDFAFPAGATPGIMVENTGSTDIVPPTLTFLSSSPASLNPGGSIPLSVAVRAMDALSGVDRVQVYLKEPGVSGETYDLGAALLDSGTPFDGTWRISAMIPAFLPPGVYAIGFSASDGLDLTSILETSAPQTVTLTTADSFSIWASGNSLSGAEAAPSADPDQDGNTNLMEFAMGMDPRVGITPAAAEGMAGLPVGSLGGQEGGRRLILQFWVPEDLLGANSLKLTYTAQFSTNGTRWTFVPQTSFVIDSGTSLLTSTGVRRLCTVWDPSPYSVSAPRMGRIRVVQNP